MTVTSIVLKQFLECANDFNSEKNTRVQGQPQFKPVVLNEIEPVMQG